MLRYTHLLKAHFYYHNQVYKFVYGCVSLDRNHRTVVAYLVPIGSPCLVLSFAPGWIVLVLGLGVGCRCCGEGLDTADTLFFWWGSDLGYCMYLLFALTLRTVGACVRAGSRTAQTHPVVRFSSSPFEFTRY
jgi:hypothetical protein